MGYLKFTIIVQEEPGNPTKMVVVNHADNGSETEVDYDIDGVQFMLDMKNQMDTSALMRFIDQRRN